MADIKAHKLQAQHNYKLAKELPEKYRDWIVTTLFYSALHYAEIFVISKTKKHSEEIAEEVNKLRKIEEDDRKQSIHAAREEALGRKDFDTQLAYSELRNMSECARYIERTQGKTGYDFIGEDSVKQARRLTDLIKKKLK